MIVFGSELSEIVQAVSTEFIEAGIEMICECDTRNGGICPAFCRAMETATCDSASLNRSHRTPTRFNDRMCYIYTSGTTGLPKAAIITHQVQVQHT